MDIIRLRVPYEFIRDQAEVSWQDLRFGLVNELVDPKAPSELAAERIAGQEQPSPALIELAGTDNEESVSRLVEQLANAEPKRSEVDIRDRWLHLVLAWIYEHQGEYADPLQKVEEVYADFGYPEQIAPFVRYMPMEGADLGIRENERRLFERWKRYVDEKREA